jgi:hypothetical protein
LEALRRRPIDLSHLTSASEARRPQVTGAISGRLAESSVIAFFDSIKRFCLISFFAIEGANEKQACGHA